MAVTKRKRKDSDGDRDNSPKNEKRKPVRRKRSK